MLRCIHLSMFFLTMDIQEAFKQQIQTTEAVNKWTGKRIKQVVFDLKNNQYPKIESMRLFLASIGFVETPAAWHYKNKTKNTYATKTAFTKCIKNLIAAKDYTHYSYYDLFRYKTHPVLEKTMRKVLQKNGWVETPAVWHAANQTVDTD